MDSVVNCMLRSLVLASLGGCVVTTVASQCGREARAFPQTGWVGEHHVTWPYGAGQVRIAAPATESVVASPIACPGAIGMTLNYDNVFLVGADSSGTQGQIVAYQKAANGFRVFASRTYPRRDFVGCLYSAATSRIYLLDRIREEIVWAPFRIGQNQLPGSWTRLVGSDTQPILGAIENHQLFWISDGPEPAIQVADYRYRDADRVEVVHKAIGPPSIVATLGPEGRVFRITETALSAGATQVEVLGPPNTRVEIVRVDGVAGLEVVGDAVSDGTGVADVGTSGLLLGATYGARCSGWSEPTGPFMAPHIVLGVNDDLEHGYSIAPAAGHGPSFVIGNPNFVFGMRIAHDGRGPEPEGSTPYPVVLVLGAMGDPIVDLGDGRMALAGTVTLTERVELGADADSLGRGDNSESVGIFASIADDPTLAGGVVLYQWYVITSPTSFKVSQITGMIIRSGRYIPPGLESLFAQPDRGAASRARERVPAVSYPEDARGLTSRSPRVRDWLRGLPSAKTYRWDQWREGLGR